MKLSLLYPESIPSSAESSEEILVAILTDKACSLKGRIEKEGNIKMKKKHW